MKTVVVTGGSGHTGQAVVQHLAEHGYWVVNVDQAPPAADDIAHRLADLTDFGQTYQCLAGADAVVHLAAIPRPTFHPAQMVFRVNTLAAYNVFEAAAALSIPRVVYASSVSVLGFPFFVRPLAPAYVPIDEDHPRQPQDAYALSKFVGEEIAEAFVRRGGLTAVSLRFPWIHTPETFQRDILPLWDDPAAGASNLWSYIDARDAALACRLALEADAAGHVACFAAAEDSFMPTPTAELVRRFYPQAEIRAAGADHWSLLSSRRAARVLGYRAQFSWRSYPLVDQR